MKISEGTTKDCQKNPKIFIISVYYLINFQEHLNTHTHMHIQSQIKFQAFSLNAGSVTTSVGIS